jgi:hypothetical protein
MAMCLGRAALNGAPNTWRSQVVGLAPAPMELLPPDGEVCLYGFCRVFCRRRRLATGRRCHRPMVDGYAGGLAPARDLDRFLQASGKVVFLDSAA